MMFIGKIMQGAIGAYQLLVVPVLPAGGCRFHPSCSNYAHQAIGRHGAVSGGWLALKRILRCHPWGKPGVDEVPPRAGVAEPEAATDANAACYPAGLC